MHTCECGGQLAIFWTFYDDDDDGRYFWEKEMCRGDNGKKTAKSSCVFYVNMHICPFFITLCYSIRKATTTACFVFINGMFYKEPTKLYQASRSL